MKSEESSRFRHPMTDTEWSHTVNTLRFVMCRIDPGIVQALTRNISRGIEFLDRFMDGYCRDTCPSCDDPCCGGRQVFFNRTDMLCLAVSEREIPEGQDADPCARRLPISGRERLPSSPHKKALCVRLVSLRKPDATF